MSAAFLEEEEARLGKAEKPGYGRGITLNGTRQGCAKFPANRQNVFIWLPQGDNLSASPHVLVHTVLSTYFILLWVYM